VCGQTRAVGDGDRPVERRDLASLAARALQAQARRHTEADDAVDADRLVDPQPPAQLLRVVVGQLPAELEEVHVGRGDGDVARASARYRDRAAERRHAADRQRQRRVHADPSARRDEADGDRDRGRGHEGPAAVRAQPAVDCCRGGVEQALQ